MSIREEIMLSGKPQLNRKINASLVFSFVQKEGPLSRADLAKRTNIRSTSISAIVQQLLDENLIREVGRGESTGGRHPILLEINPSGVHAVGLEVAEDVINGVLVDLCGKVLSVESLALSDTSVEHIVSLCGDMVNKLSRKVSIPRDKITGVGIAVPGIISKDDGSILFSHAMGWKDVPLMEILKQELGFDVHVLNNAMAGALSEYFGGMGQGVRSLLYFLVHLRHVRDETMTSLGCGIVLDGRSYCGEGKIAGEVRADFVNPVVTARRMFGDRAPSDFDALLEASRNDPAVYAPVWNVFAEQLAESIGWGMDFLNPGRVIIGTDIPELGEFVSEPILQILRRQTITGLLTENSVVSEQSGIRLHFAPVRMETLARGAIVPRLQELSLTPLLRDSVLS